MAEGCELYGLEGNKTCGGDDTAVCTDVELQCSTPETYIRKKEKKQRDGKVYVMCILPCLKM